MMLADFLLQHAWSIGIVLVGLIVLPGALFHLRQRVAFVPSSMRVVDAMLGIVALRDGETIVDLGAGDARFLIAAQKRCPRSQVIGYEGAWWVYLLGRVRLMLSGSRATLRFRDFFSVSLSDVDVICSYLSISAMQRLLPKLQYELKPGARVVSHAFSLPGIVPAQTVRVRMPIGETTVYCYTFPFVTTPPVPSGSAMSDARS